MERGAGMEVFLFPAAKDLPYTACEKGSAGAGCKFNQLPIPAKAGISLSSNCFGGAVSERQLEIGEIPAFAGMERGRGREWKKGGNGRRAGMEKQETFIIPKQNKSPPY